MAIVVDLPEAAQTFVDEQVTAGRFGSPAEFITNLVEQARIHAARDRVDALLLAGLASGTPIEVDRDWWLRKSDEWAAKYAGESAQ